jgi:hypothetical protein
VSDALQVSVQRGEVARPPDVQAGDVSVADGFLAGRLRADLGQREGDFDATFVIHFLSFPLHLHEV